MKICRKCGNFNDRGLKRCSLCSEELPEAGISFYIYRKKVNLYQYFVKPVIDPVRDKVIRWFKSLDRLSKFLIVEGLLLILSFGIFYNIGKSMTAPMKAAEQYAEAFKNHDWKNMYRLSSLPDSGFLTEEAFIKQMDSLYNTVTDSDIEEFGSRDEKKFIMNYTLEGDMGGDKGYLEVTRQSENVMLFFPSWKIRMDSLIAEDYKIHVPVGAVVSVDGYILEEADKMKVEGGEDIYCITLFKGRHQLQIAQPFKETITEEIDDYSWNGFQAPLAAFSKEALDTFEGKMKELLYAYCSGALENKPYSEIGDLTASAYEENNQYVYENLVDRLMYNDEQHLKEISFSNFSIETGYETDNLSAEMILYFDYICNYTELYEDWYTNKVTTEDKQTSGSSEMGASFVWDGNTYQLGAVWFDY